MDRTKLFIVLIGMLLIGSVTLAFNVQSKASSSQLDEAQVGLIYIDTVSQFEGLSMPRVPFAHEKHTNLLEDRGKDCQTCHMEAEEGLVFSYERIINKESPEKLKKVYHDNCIGCHSSMRRDGLSSGPRDGECRKCHTGKTEERNQPFVMEKALHYTHWSSEEIAYRDKEQNCGACHHKYDAEKNVLYWDEGREQNCRYCHEEEMKEDARSMRTAAHDQCVRCHARKRDTAESEVGPIHCEGCHSREAREEIENAGRELLEKMGEIPRLERGQPRAALMIPEDEAREEPRESPGEMGPVPFDHRAHEGYQDTCRVCHHKSLEACGECHTLSGSREGDFVQLSQAMHEVQSDRSCTGCHQNQMQESECAGCHQFIPRERITGRDTECNTCHLSKNASIGYKDLAGMSRQMREEKAREFISSRNSTLKLYPEEDIPEEVTIDYLADTYEGARMPHRQIVLSLAEKVESNTMAGYFHQSEGTLCQGCHHNSPASREPPSCRSCHGKPFQERDPLKPGLQAAYHQQCMNCHQAMNIEEPADRDCTACHQESGDKPASDR